MTTVMPTSISAAAVKPTFLQVVESDVEDVFKWIEGEAEQAAIGVWNTIFKPLLLSSEPKIMQDVITLVIAYMLNATATQKAADLSAIEADFSTFVAASKPELIGALEKLGSAIVQGLLSLLMGLLTSGKLVIPAAV